MPSILTDFEYDIFISYRQNDNQDGWVTEFVNNLNREIKATFKEDISIYFDENPHDGLLETHDVDHSLAKKLKCLIFIPIISKTYCDPNTFAWTNEFLAFNKLAENDAYGLKITLPNGNTASRVLPIKIHDISDADKQLVEDEIGFLRAIDFVYQEPGVNRPLKNEDIKEDNLNKTNYRNQINKVANAIQEILTGLKEPASVSEKVDSEKSRESQPKKSEFRSELKRRSVLKAGLMYVIIGLLLWKAADIGIGLLNLPENILKLVTLLLIIFFPIAIAMAWLYERGPQGFIRTGSAASRENPFTDAQKKPLTNNTFILVLIITVAALFVIFPSGASGPEAGIYASEASVAILPFHNNTGNQEMDHYGFGLASEIRTQLAVSKQFDFISSMQATIMYKNSNQPPLTIGKELGVTHILSGMYQGNQSNLQVIVELVDAGSGNIVWSIQYQSKYQDLFLLQASIAEIVIEKFDGQNAERSTQSFNMEAFAEYIRGVERSNFSGLPKERLRSISYFENAVRIDSTLLPAWVGLVENLAYHYWLLPNDTSVTLEMIKPLLDYIDTHFEDSWEKNYANGVYAYWVERDYEKGKQLFLAVLKDNPESSEANSLLGAISKRRLQHKEALKYSSKAALLSNSATQWSEMGQIFQDNGDYENAEIAFRNEIKVNQVSAFGFFYQLIRSQNRLEELPEVTKLLYGNTYQADLYLQQSEYNSLLEFLYNVETDSTFNTLALPYYKARVYFALKQEDSAKVYAKAYFLVREQSPELSQLGLGSIAPFWWDADMYGVLENKENLASWLDMPEKQVEQDLRAQASIAVLEIRHLVFKREYDVATTKLEQLNRNIPQFGNYHWLKLPMFDRIKEEYPPFLDAINNLKLPPKVSEIDPSKM